MARMKNQPLAIEQLPAMAGDDRGVDVVPYRLAEHIGAEAAPFAAPEADVEREHVDPVQQQGFRVTRAGVGPGYSERRTRRGRRPRDRGRSDDDVAVDETDPENPAAFGFGGENVEHLRHDRFARSGGAAHEARVQPEDAQLLEPRTARGIVVEREVHRVGGAGCGQRRERLLGRPLTGRGLGATGNGRAEQDGRH